MLFLSDKTDFNGWLDFDWFIEIDTFEFFIEAIDSWNRNNPNNEQRWEVWPEDIEAFSMIPKEITDSGLKNEEEIYAIKQEWLDFAKYISETPDIKIKENTITIEGKYGTKFSFDISLEQSLWLPPGGVNEYGSSLKEIQNGARGKSDLGIHMKYLEASTSTWKIKINTPDDGLGFQDFPEHVKGLELKQYEAYSTYIYPTKDTLLDNLKYLFELLIEDFHIWEILHEQEVNRRKLDEEWNKKWPNGRPDDWMYL